MDQNPWQVESLQDFLYLKCPECNFDTKAEESFKDHAKENHPLSCVFFGDVFVKQEILDYEEKIEENNMENYYFPVTEEQNPDISENNYEKLPLIKKELTGDGSINLKDFYTTNNLDEDDGYMTKKCPKCDFSTPNPKKLRIHIKKVHFINAKKKNTEKVQDTSNMNLPLDLNFPMSDFARAKSITYSQVQAKTKELPWCHICKINFQFEQELMSHFDSSHPEDKPYKCFICVISFARKNKLKRHLDSVHEEKKSSQSHQCPLCEKILSRRDHLTEHIKSVHEKEKSYECQICKTFFSNKAHLKRHIATVHEKIKPFKCTDCDSSFSQRHLLTRHFQTVHEGHKPFQCSICDERFSRKDHLMKHNKTHMGQDMGLQWDSNEKRLAWVSNEPVDASQLLEVEMKEEDFCQVDC